MVEEGGEGEDWLRKEEGGGLVEEGGEGEDWLRKEGGGEDWLKKEKGVRGVGRYD